jgi:hypothetical protein
MLGSTGSATGERITLPGVVVDVSWKYGQRDRGEDHATR